MGVWWQIWRADGEGVVAEALRTSLVLWLGFSSCSLQRLCGRVLRGLFCWCYVNKWPSEAFVAVGVDDVEFFSTFGPIFS